MQNRIRELQNKLSQTALFTRAPRPVRWIVGLFSKNLGLKLLSLLLAILLWNYVISSDSSITRPKTLYNITGYLSGQSTLNGYGLALLGDPAQALSGISVTVEAPQANYSRVSADNVQVTLDLSNIRSAGTQEVYFRATTSYGRVIAISPESVRLTFETLDSRTVAVNTVLQGESEGYWYDVTRTNPSLLTISGASSMVQSITSAQVNVDVTGLITPTTPSLPYVLLDASGQEVPQTMLNRSTSSISVSLDIYPCRSIPVSTDLSSVVTGQPADGYVVHSVSIQPDKVTVAADRELLDSLTELVIEPVSVEDASQSFSARAKISMLPDFVDVSTEQVYVNVNIGEETASAYLENVNVIISGIEGNMSVTYEPLGAYISGPKSAVQQLESEGLTVGVDVSGLEEGYYLITQNYDIERYPDIDIQTEALSLTLTDIGDDE